MLGTVQLYTGFPAASPSAAMGSPLGYASIERWSADDRNGIARVACHQNMALCKTTNEVGCSGSSTALIVRPPSASGFMPVRSPTE